MKNEREKKKTLAVYFFLALESVDAKKMSPQRGQVQSIDITVLSFHNNIHNYC